MRYRSKDFFQNDDATKAQVKLYHGLSFLLQQLVLQICALKQAESHFKEEGTLHIPVGVRSTMVDLFSKNNPHVYQSSSIEDAVHSCGICTGISTERSAQLATHVCAVHKFAINVSVNVDDCCSSEIFCFSSRIESN